MSLADTSEATIGGLFYRQVRDLTLSTAKASTKYKADLGKILDSYAPESSMLYRKRFATYK